MEKFGIFELLDTLSALMLPKEDGTPPAPPPRPDTRDAAFSPPAYGETPENKEEGGNTALSSFLARHDAAARKIDGKK